MFTVSKVGSIQFNNMLTEQSKMISDGTWIQLELRANTESGPQRELTFQLTEPTIWLLF